MSGYIILTIGREVSTYALFIFWLFFKFQTISNTHSFYPIRSKKPCRLERDLGRPLIWPKLRFLVEDMLVLTRIKRNCRSSSGITHAAGSCWHRNRSSSRLDGRRNNRRRETFYLERKAKSKCGTRPFCQLEANHDRFPTHVRSSNRAPANSVVLRQNHILVLWQWIQKLQLNCYGVWSDPETTRHQLHAFGDDIQ